MKQIDIRIIRRADSDAVARLYREAGWWREEYTPDFIPAVLRKSFCVAGAFHHKLLVGMGRAISDGVSDAYIQDVAVLEHYRGRGIGSGIISAIVAHLRRHDIDWIGLVGSPHTRNFYEKLGFRVMPGHLPMLFDPESAPEAKGGDHESAL